MDTPISPIPINDLDTLIKNMQPVLGPECAFCQVDDKTFRSLATLPLAMFREVEAVTVIYPLEIAQELNLPINWVGSKITLNVNSSLEAVGFLAKVTSALAQAGIGVNAFSPIFHDHLFVKPEDAKRSMQILAEMSRAAWSKG